MSQYSQMMGSFIRTSNYPMEANYIFATEEALKEFYSDPINANTLHKGLLRVVENDGTGNQGLYWVTKKQTNDELEFTRLVSGTNIQGIDEWLDKLQELLDAEIEARQKADQAIWGTNDPTNVIEELNSLLDISEAIVNIREDLQRIHSELIDSDDSIQKSLKTELKATVGTLDNDIVEYLKTLPYLSLTQVATALDKFLNTVDDSTNKINTLPELQFFLEGYTDTQKLRHVLMDLQAEILGNPLPTEDFRTLRAIEDFVRILKSDSENVDENLQSELNQTLVGVGLSGDGSYNADKSTHYLQDATSVMNALKTLDNLMFEALQEMTISPSNNDVVDLAVRKELEGWVIGANLRLSNAINNDLIKKEDGLYYNTDLTYKDGVLSLVVNGKIVATHVLGFSSLVDSAKYDPSQESIVIVFKLLNGDKQTVTIPVGALIREWEIDNNIVDKVVELERTTTVDGPDKLSADVRLYADRHNILKKVGNTLFVDGQTDNITHNDTSLAEVIEQLKSSIQANVDNDAVISSRLDDEISRATAKELEIITKHNEDKLELEGEIQEFKTETADNFNIADNNLAAEINRATLRENALESDIKDLKIKDTQLDAADTAMRERMSTYESKQTQLDNKIDLEVQRASSVENGLNSRVELLEGALIAVDGKLDAEITRAKDAELALEGKIHLLNDSIDSLSTKISSAEQVNSVQAGQIETLKGRVDSLQNADSTLEYKIQQEAERANNAENLLDQKISTVSTKVDTTDSRVTSEIERAIAKESSIETSIVALDGKVNTQKTELEYAIHQQADSFKEIVDLAVNDINTSTQQAIDDLNTEVQSKVGSVELEEVSDLEYNLKVDGTTIGTINIPEDLFLLDVELVDNRVIKFTFKTNSGIVVTDLDMAGVISAALEEIQNQLATKAPIDSPIFTGIPQVSTSPDASDASQRIPSTNWVRERIDKSIGTTKEDLNQHVLDFGNPHRVTAEQVGAYAKNDVYSKTEVDNEMQNVQSQLDLKANLTSDGKIDPSQLPEGLYEWIDL